MSCLNKVMLIGYCGRDPEGRQTSTGETFAIVSLATTERYNDKQTHETQEQTEWHKIIFFGKLAEVVREYVHKGTQLYVEGKIKTRKWMDQQGQERSKTEIVAQGMKLLSRQPQQATEISSAFPQTEEGFLF